MSEVKNEATEATTNPSIEEPKNNENGADKAATEDKETVVDVKAESGNGTEEAKQPEKKPSGPRTYENGMLKTSASVQYDRGGKNSKYDPSVLKTSDNPKEIRGQVGSFKMF